ncbi:TolC family protein [Bremerella cremea]|uniref:TolC family protein n=1 Tax=Bremerella cremea TaxID=1031537 RepID=UPI0031E61034
MKTQFHQAWMLVLVGTVILTGCQPTQPFYFKESGDLSLYLDKATDIEYADVEYNRLTEVENAEAPYTISDPFEMDESKIWNLTLEEAVADSLKNSKAIRTAGGNAVFRVIPGTTLTSAAIPTNLVTRNDAMPTIYDPAIVESDPTFGVEGALSEFDAQLNATFNWDRVDRPQNYQTGSPFFISEFGQNLATGTVELTKKSATGTQWFMRQNTTYDYNNRGSLIYPSSWLANIEMEARHPLLRGSGVQVNRVNVMLARIREDVSLADFETNIRNLVSDVEEAYWQLYFAYHNLEAAKTGRDSALVTWRRVHALMANGAEGGEAEKEAQARQQYFEFRSRTEAALRDLYKAEGSLRYFMGLAATDGRLIRPASEPTDAWVAFDWFDIHQEALNRSPELRRQQWRLKQRELELITARNQLLPQLDAVALYRFLGLGDDLITGNRNGKNFNEPGSYAWEVLTEGNYQEYTLGLQFSMPIGFRSELAGVRNVQLQIAREKAVIEDMELEVSHLLTDTIRDLDSNYSLVQTNLNRLIAADKEVDSVQAAYDAGTVTLDLLLDAQRRRSDAQIVYFQALVEYNIAIKDVHMRKGSLLDYNGVYLAEGPWPEKAYFDAQGHARRRSASTYLDYGYTRPGVISRGAVPQGPISHGTMEEGTIIYEDEATGSGEVIGTPTPAKVPTSLNTVSLEPPAAPQVASRSAQSKSELDWNKLGLNELVSEVRQTKSSPQPTPATAPSSRRVVKSVSHESGQNPTPAKTASATSGWQAAKR